MAVERGAVVAREVCEETILHYCDLRHDTAD